jgi:hypothetical protein
MMTRTSASLAMASAFVGASVLSGTLAMPIAHADPLDSIIGTVKKDRAGTRCPQLTYNPALEGAAQTFAKSENPVDGQPGNYNGRTLAFLGSGDPQAAATTSAYQRGAGGLISNCDFTEFGVGFTRHEDRSVDVVTIVFGAPAASVVAAPPPVAAPPVAAPPVVPPVENKPLQGPTVSAKAGLTGVTFHVTDRSGIASQCTYASEGFTSDSFSVPANGSFDLFVPAIREFRNRTGTVTCDNNTSASTSVNF